MLFPPLMGIEVVGTRVRSATLVVDAKVSLNLVAQTLEQASGQRAAASPLLAVGVVRTRRRIALRRSTLALVPCSLWAFGARAPRCRAPLNPRALVRCRRSRAVRVRR